MTISHIRSSVVPSGAVQVRPHGGPSDRQGPDPAPQRSATGTTPLPSPSQILTDAEKSFFEGLFPGAASEIRGHITYTQTGRQPVHQPGSVVDRKG